MSSRPAAGTLSSPKEQWMRDRGLLLHSPVPSRRRSLASSLPAYDAYSVHPLLPVPLLARDLLQRALQGCAGKRPHGTPHGLMHAPVRATPPRRIPRHCETITRRCYILASLRGSDDAKNI